jgi:hypothetical protein
MSELYGSSAAQPDYSGLEVVPASTAPEVDDSRSPAETLVDHHLYKLSVQAPLELWRGADDAPQVSSLEKANGAEILAPTSTPQPWWRRKIWIIALVAAVLVIVGAVVGVVVATRQVFDPGILTCIC